VPAVAAQTWCSTKSAALNHGSYKGTLINAGKPGLVELFNNSSQTSTSAGPV